MANIKEVVIKFEDGSEQVVEATKGEVVEGTGLADIVEAPVEPETAPEATQEPKVEEPVVEPVAEPAVEVTSPTE